jgi:peptide/nickel transport system substrate-binding protein
MGGNKMRVIWIHMSLILFLLGIPWIGYGASPVPYKPAGTISWGIHFQIAADWVDPGAATRTTQWVVFYAIHDALLKDMPGELSAPSLAESWNMSPDGKIYEFKIRKGVKFHNGDTLTAEDVKFSYERYHGIYNKIMKEKVARVEIVDPYLIRFHLKEPWNDFMEYYTGIGMTGANWIIPKKYFQEVGEEGFSRKPIGCGPYKFVKLEPGVELVVEAFEDYWRMVPHVKTLRIKSVPERGTALAMLKAGEIDIAWQMQGSLADEVIRNPKLTYFPSPSPGVLFLFFSEQWNPNSPWSNIKVREAAQLAIDRKTMVETTMKGAKIPGQIVPEELLWAKKFPMIPYNPKRAKELLTEAGYPKGFDGGTLYGDRAYSTHFDLVATYWKNVGINVKVQAMERAAYYDVQQNHGLRGVLFDTTSGGATAASRLTMNLEVGASGYGRYEDIDALMKQQKIEQNVKKRETILHQIQQLVVDKKMFCVLHQNATPSGIGPRVKTHAMGLVSWFSSPYEMVELK